MSRNNKETSENMQNSNKPSKAQKQLLDKLSKMEKDEAIAEIQKADVFRDAAKAITTEYTRLGELAIKSDTASTMEILSTYKIPVEMLSKKLDNDNLSSEDLHYYGELLITILSLMKEIDEKKRQGLKDILTIIFKGLCAVLATILIYLGFKKAPKENDDNSHEDE